jgi:hypothetical protein
MPQISKELLITHRDKLHICAPFKFFNDRLFLGCCTARNNDEDEEHDEDADLNDFEMAMQDLDQDSRDGAEQGGEEEEN